MEQLINKLKKNYKEKKYEIDIDSFELKKIISALVIYEKIDLALDETIIFFHKE